MDDNKGLKRLFKLSCGHCKTVFLGTYKQAWNQKRVSTTPFCSSFCRTTFAAAKLRKEVPMRGPCKLCGAPFASRQEKLFCSMKCYVSSSQFSDMLVANRRNLLDPELRRKTGLPTRRGKERPCLECGKPVYRKPSCARKYCTTACYRAYRAKRFDRFIANPESVSLPQNFDEFLSRTELHCLVEGCGWSGKHLSVHVNAMHGIKAADFKRASGFNSGSGLIGSDLARRLSERALHGVAVDVDLRPVSPGPSQPLEFGSVVAYRSLEAREHGAKARALIAGMPGPRRTCRACNVSFRQSTVFGLAVYCTRECRDRFCAERLRRPKRPRLRAADGTFLPHPLEEAPFVRSSDPRESTNRDERGSKNQ